MSMKKLSLFFLLLVLLFVGCSKEQGKEEGTTYQIYYLNREETKLVTQEYQTTTTDTTEITRELITQLEENPKEVNVLSTIRNFEVTGFQFAEERLDLTVDEKYKEQSATTEVLARAAIVKTMTQIEGIKYVSMAVRDTPLTDQFGNAIGVMGVDTFIDNTSKEMDSYEPIDLTLYFADESGKYLVKESRTVAYNNKMSMEKLVVDELLKGPQKKGGYPIIDSQATTISVTVTDGICYVNFSSKFLTPVSNVSGPITIYGIVNSLIELSTINKVQILIDGKNEIKFRDNVVLAKVYERNLDLLKIE